MTARLCTPSPLARSLLTCSLLIGLAACGGLDGFDAVQHESLIAGNYAEACVETSDCTGGLLCLTNGQERPGVDGVCTSRCDSDNDCPGSTDCYIFDDDDGHVCVPYCETDAHCQQLNPNLSCELRTSSCPEGHDPDNINEEDCQSTCVGVGLFSTSSP